MVQLGDYLQTQKFPRRTNLRLATLKAWTATVLFILLAFLIESFVVLYAIKLGVREDPNFILELNFQIPGTSWGASFVISPLFHLVPLAVVITLAFTWVYLTGHLVGKTQEIVKGKGKKELKLKELFGKIKFELSSKTVKSALFILIAFLVLIVAFSLLTYPQMIYRAIAYAYQNNPSLRNFVRGVAETLAPLGNAFSPINNALLSAAPIFREFFVGVGALIRPLAELDNNGKYLFFQNAAAWISALASLFYGEYIQKHRRYRRI